ncbi:hypothetical protein GR04_24480 [Escherichia coli]|nr:hypothetical protein GR04_24480 [Escherichia coli]
MRVSAWEALCAGDAAAKRGLKKHNGFSRYKSPSLLSPLLKYFQHAQKPHSKSAFSIRYYSDKGTQ